MIQKTPEIDPEAIPRKEETHNRSRRESKECIIYQNSEKTKKDPEKTQKRPRKDLEKTFQEKTKKKQIKTQERSRIQKDP